MYIALGLPNPIGCFHFGCIFLLKGIFLSKPFQVKEVFEKPDLFLKDIIPAASKYL